MDIKAAEAGGNRRPGGSPVRASENTAIRSGVDGAAGDLGEEDRLHVEAGYARVGEEPVEPVIGAPVDAGIASRVDGGGGSRCCSDCGDCHVCGDAGHEAPVAAARGRPEGSAVGPGVDGVRKQRVDREGADVRLGDAGTGGCPAAAAVGGFKDAPTPGGGVQHLRAGRISGNCGYIEM